MKIYPEYEHIFNSASDAIRFMQDTEFQQNVSIYHIDDHKAREIVDELYAVVKAYNKGKPLKDQILPTTPYGYRGILGCLGVQCYEIGLGTYERNRECIVMFGRYVPDVLDTSSETPCIRPGLKALYSLGMMIDMMSGGRQ